MIKERIDIQGRMIDVTQKLARRATLWCLRRLSGSVDIAAEVKLLSADMRKLERGLEGLLSDEGRNLFVDRSDQLIAAGVPEDLARRMAALGPLRSSLDIVQVGNSNTRAITEVGEVYFAVGAELNLDWLRAAAEAVVPENNWDRLAIAAIIDDLYGQQRALTNSVFVGSSGHAGRKAFEHWVKQHQTPIKRSSELIKEFKTMGALDVSKLAYANRQFRSMIS